MPSLTKYVADLRANARSVSFVAALFVGSITGLNAVIFENAMGALVFTGPFEPYVLQGTGLFLFGTFVLCLVIALTSGYRGTISIPPVPTTMTIAVIVASLGVLEDGMFPTTVVTLAIGGIAAGLCFLIIGQLRLANLLQFIPFPVSCGFLAGTGAEVCVAAVAMTGLEPDWQVLSRLLEPHLLWNWGPAFLYSVALIVMTARWKSVLLFPASFVLASVLYHLGMALSGISIADAREMGLLFPSIETGQVWPAMGLADLQQVNWAAVASQIPNIITLILITLINVVMNTSGLEVATGTELDWNDEFKSSGLASVLSGLGGGPPGCVFVAVTMRSKIFGVESWLTGLFASLVIALCLFAGGDLLTVVPVPFMAGMIFVTGWAMVADWLVKNRRKLPRADYGIVLLIVVTILVFGFLEGVALGMVVTVVFFAARLSRVNLVESEFTARTRQSTKARPIPDQAILRDQGDRVRGYRLQGYIFFGSAYPLIDRLKRDLRGDPRPACVLLDFSAVSGSDPSAVNALCRLVQFAQSAGARMVLSAASERLRDRLRRNLPPAAHGKLLFAADADEALEACEDRVIALTRKELAASEADARESLLEDVADPLEQQLDLLIAFEALTEELRPWLESREYESGAALAAPGEPTPGLQFLAAGRASVYDSKGARLRQIVPGDVVAPRAAIGAGPSLVSAVADQPCRTHVLSTEDLRSLERDHQELTLKLYRYLVTVGYKATPQPGRQG